MKPLSTLKIAAVLSALTFSVPIHAQTWIKNPTNGHYYALTPRLSWKASEAHAVSQGGHLATVRSQAEHDWLTKTFGNQYLWIGLTDEAKEGTWVWSSGENATFRNWCTGQPDNRPNEDYVHIFDNSKPISCSGRRWNDHTNTAIGLPGGVPAGIMELKTFTGKIRFFGTGCKDIFKNQHNITATPLPRLGKTVSVGSTRATPGADFWIIGASELKPPAKLVFPFLPNCQLYVLPQILLLGPTDRPRTFPIPNTKALIGAKVYMQLGYFNLQNSFFVMSLTNAVELTIGS